MHVDVVAHQPHGPIGVHVSHVVALGPQASPPSTSGPASTPGLLPLSVAGTTPPSRGGMLPESIRTVPPSVPARLPLSPQPTSATMTSAETSTDA